MTSIRQIVGGGLAVLVVHWPFWWWMGHSGVQPHNLVEGVSDLVVNVAILVVPITLSRYNAVYLIY